MVERVSEADGVPERVDDNEAPKENEAEGVGEHVGDQPQATAESRLTNPAVPACVPDVTEVGKLYHEVPGTYAATEGLT